MQQSPNDDTATGANQKLMMVYHNFSMCVLYKVYEFLCSHAFEFCGHYDCSSVSLSLSSSCCLSRMPINSSLREKIVTNDVDLELGRFTSFISSMYRRAPCTDLPYRQF